MVFPNTNDTFVNLARLNTTRTEHTIVRYSAERDEYVIGSTGGVTSAKRKRGCFDFCFETAMSSPYLPPELLDHIVDILRRKRKALRNCCLVSRSWVPRTRKHLFAHVKFGTEKNLESWKEIFPDPSTSPARYAKTLSVDCARAVTAADAEPGGWIGTFSQVTELEVGSQRTYADEVGVSLVPLHGFSPTLKSLHVDFIFLPSSEVFDLVLSFPLLEDLTVITSYDMLSVSDDDGSDELPAIVQPSNPPIFTGTLELSRGGTRPIAHRLLSLQSGIRFRKLILMQFHEEDISLTTGLVEVCSHTLESLDITCSLTGASVWDLRSTQ